METKSVFARTQAESSGETVSRAFYNLTIGAVLSWGFLVNWWTVRNIPPDVIYSINHWVFLIGYFASCFLGVYLFTSSTNPWVSFLGYNFVVVPFGLIINVVVARYNPTLVEDAIRITGFATVIMMALGTLFPAFFRAIGRALSVALLAVIVVELVEIFIFHIHHEFIDWIVAVIFCGYIGYDWGRANAIPSTLDNAVDSAASLYMDIINLFLRILSILGRRK